MEIYREFLAKNDFIHENKIKSIFSSISYYGF